MTLIVDATPLLAMGDRKDRFHSEVRTLLEEEVGELVVPAPVTAEVDHLLRTRGHGHAARLFLRDVAEGRFNVEGLTRAEHGLAAELDQKYADLDVGLADLSIVILADRLGTDRVLTFDERHFRVLRPISDYSAFCILPRDS